MTMEYLALIWGAIGTAAGVAVAVGLFLLAMWLVAHARRGNRYVRERRHDPHALDPKQGRPAVRQAANDGRDISQ